ncbi:MAG: CDP-alcohol phosphatidyltransferase family protein [Rhodospirillales bacterium]|nr:CDP-alcohol phosphatidyltransferase family protein [Rhodospirillales bacterium]
MSIPNFITLARLISVPVTVWLILNGSFAGAFWLFVAAGVSDAIDGVIAKRFDMETELGQFMDPLADKALLVGVYITLGHTGHLATWLVILVVFRDLLIIGGAILFQTITQSLTMAPLMVSKVNTVAQIMLAALLLGTLAYSVDAVAVIDTMVYIVALTTFISGAAYVVSWTRRASMMEGDKGS